MQMRNISALFMLSGSKDDLYHITGCGDVLKMKWKPEMINQTNEHNHFLHWRQWTFCQCEDGEAEGPFTQTWFHENTHVHRGGCVCVQCFTK